MENLNASVRPGSSSDDIDILKYAELRKALQCIAKKLGFIEERTLSTPYIFAFSSEDIRLIVMTTPVLFNYETLCYAFQGVLMVAESDVSPTTAPALKTPSIWRKHPLHFYQDLEEAIARARFILENQEQPKQLPQATQVSSIEYISLKNSRTLQFHPNNP